MAFAASVIWEVRTTGVSTNGGGFDPISGTPGTDYSQQDAPQISYTDLVIDATTNTNCTSAGNPFTSAHVGNLINITGGAGFTTQRVQIMSVAGAVATCDKSLGTLGSTAGVGKLGGALTLMTAPLVVPGNTVYVKGSAAFTTGATQAFNTNGSAGNPITYIGYTTTRGDNGMVTVQQTAGTGVTLFSITGTFRRFFNFIADVNSKATSTGWSIASGSCVLQNCKAINFTTAGFTFIRCHLVNCWATGGVAGATAAFNSTNVTPVLINCVASGNACPGFIHNAASGAFAVFIGCIAANNTGASTYDGFRVNNTSSATFVGCVAYGNGGNGILLDTTTSATAGDAAMLYNCILVSNGLYGLQSNTTNYITSGTMPLPLDYNAYFNNTSGARNNMPTGTHDVALSGDPFTNGASLDFSLNNTAGAGAACRAAGFPGVLQAGGTGYHDIGALQHQDAGGAAGMLYVPSLDGL